MHHLFSLLFLLFSLTFYEQLAPFCGLPVQRLHGTLQAFERGTIDE